jgi:hypothetical protein
MEHGIQVQDTWTIGLRQCNKSGWSKKCISG